MRRIYTDMAHFRGPMQPLPFGAAPASPSGRAYYDMANFRTPMDDGYFQNNTLFGLGATTLTPTEQIRAALSIADKDINDAIAALKMGRKDVAAQKQTSAQEQFAIVYDLAKRSECPEAERLLGPWITDVGMTNPSVGNLQSVQSNLRAMASSPDWQTCVQAVEAGVSTRRPAWLKPLMVVAALGAAGGLAWYLLKD